MRCDDSGAGHSRVGGADSAHHGRTHLGAQVNWEAEAREVMALGLGWRKRAIEAEARLAQIIEHLDDSRRYRPHTEGWYYTREVRAVAKGETR